MTTKKKHDTERYRSCKRIFTCKLGFDTTENEPSKFCHLLTNSENRAKCWIRSILVTALISHRAGQTLQLPPTTSETRMFWTFPWLPTDLSLESTCHLLIYPNAAMKHLVNSKYFRLAIKFPSAGEKFRRVCHVPAWRGDRTDKRQLHCMHSTNTCIPRIGGMQDQEMAGNSRLVSQIWFGAGITPSDKGECILRKRIQSSDLSWLRKLKMLEKFIETSKDSKLHFTRKHEKQKMRLTPIFCHSR